MKTTSQIYSQFLVSSQTNYTCTNLSEHLEGLDENSIYRFLSDNKFTPSTIAKNEKAAQLIWNGSLKNYFAFLSLNAAI